MLSIICIHTVHVFILSIILFQLLRRLPHPQQASQFQNKQYSLLGVITLAIFIKITLFNAISIHVFSSNEIKNKVIMMSCKTYFSHKGRETIFELCKIPFDLIFIVHSQGLESMWFFLKLIINMVLSHRIISLLNIQFKCS